MKYIASILILVISFSAAHGQDKHDAAKRVDETNKVLKPIEDYVKTIEEFVDKTGEPHLIIADVADYNGSDKAEWAGFESRDEYEKNPRDSYTTAFIWKKDDQVVQVNFTYSSPSGDWAQYVFYTFYENGTLAKADRELRTFMGDIIVNRIDFHDTGGKLIKTSKTFRDLATKKTVKEPESFMDVDVEIYQAVDKLPFRSLLSAPISKNK